jgi:threonine/homoserine/homoserine lactone efflux protein
MDDWMVYHINRISRFLINEWVRVFILLMSILNYYAIILFLAIQYDINHKLSGGPATMFYGLAAGPVIAVILSPITYILQRFLLKKKIRIVPQAISFLHLALFAFLMGCAAYLYIDHMIHKGGTP